MKLGKSISRIFFSLIFKDNLLEKFSTLIYLIFHEFFLPGHYISLIFRQKSHAPNFWAQSSITKGVMIFAKLVLISTNQNAQITNFAFGKLVSTKRLSRWFVPWSKNSKPFFTDIWTFNKWFSTWKCVNGRCFLWRKSIRIHWKHWKNLWC